MEKETEERLGVEDNQNKKDDMENASDMIRCEDKPSRRDP